jgi:hypothetical protein
MRLDHDRATSSERGRGVSSSHRKSEREIAGAQNRNRTKSNLAQTKIGTRQGLAIWQGRIERSVDPSAFANDGSEEIELTNRPNPFAFNPASRQASLRAGSVYKTISKIKDSLANGSEELCSCFEWRFAIGIERFLREQACAVDLNLAASCKIWLHV